MTNIVQRFFGSEDVANELAQLHEKLRDAVEDVKKLEEDWKEKVRLTQEFLRNWNKAWDLKKLKNNIRVIRSLGSEEQREFREEKEALLYVRHIILKAEIPIAAYTRINNIFKKEESVWNQLERLLQEQIRFIDTYSGQDIGVVQFHIKEFIALLREEGKFLGIDYNLVRDVEKAERVIENKIKRGLLRKFLFLRRRKLKEWGFPFNENPELGNYLVWQWNETSQLANNLEPDELRYVFPSLPLLREVVHRHGILNTGLSLAKIYRAAKPNYVRVQDFERCKDIIRKYGLECITAIAEASTPRWITQLIYDGIPANTEIILRYGFKEISEIAHATDPRFVFDLFLSGLTKCSRSSIIKTQNHLRVLVTIAKHSNRESVSTLFEKGLPLLAPLSSNSNDLLEAGLFLCERPQLFNHPYFRFFIQGISSKEEFFTKCREFEELITDIRFSTIQGLNSMGYLCLHVTNALAGGATGLKELKSDPFQNIINDINHRYDYNPSISVIHPTTKSSLIMFDKGEIGGSIGVVYDYGQIYEAYFGDAGTKEEDHPNSGRLYRTGRNSQTYTYEPALVIKYSKGHYNELLIEKWTVSAIFYTKGCHQLIIDKLKGISDELSFKEYLNGAYWYRTTKLGIPDKIIKVFPIYEIDISNNAWKIVYMPQNPNYRVSLYKPDNNTYTAVPK